jgi:integrase
MLNDACIDDVISKNPANGIKAIKDKKSEKAVDTIHRALTLQEQKTFMDEVESDYYYEFIAFLLCSGLRTGEASALKWRDIDTKENQIHIRRTMTFDESGVMIIGDSTKSDAGMRDIPLTPILKNILNRWKNKIGKTSLDGTIFVAVNGGYVYSGAVNRAIANALDRLKEKGVDIPIFAAHCLRDTYATRFLEETGDLQTLKTLLGHSSLAMTSDLYAHVLPNTKQEKAEKVNFDIAL